MTLACHREMGGSGEQPWLVWLHGFLGSGADWQGVLPYCAGWPSLTIDLPGHGASRDITSQGFAQTGQQLQETLLAQGITRYWLIGYSLGGRIAMDYCCRQRPAGLQGLIVEGGHPGLPDEVARQQRIMHDRQWAQRLRAEPLAQVLADWYRQPVFADLSPTQRSALITRRSQNDGMALAIMLEATSLGQQSWLLPQLQQLESPMVWLCGQHDSKFQRLAADYTLPLCTIAEAGHNAHLAQPAAYAHQLLSFIAQRS